MILRFSFLLTLSLVAAAQWTRVDVPTTASLRGLSVVSATVIWASGTAGTVIKTTDGGKTWSVIVVTGAEKLDFRGIHAFDDKTAVIISSGPAEKDQARIYRTADGGKSWQQVLEEKRAGIFFDAIAFWDRLHGIVLSDPIDGHFALFRTDDGGATWKQIPPAALPQALPNEGAFAASNSCLTIQGASNVWFATGGADVARVFRSHDRGQHWEVSETPMHSANASSGIFSLAFEEKKNGIAVGGDYAHPDHSALPNLLFTSDGGRSWQAGAASDLPGIYLSSVAIAKTHVKNCDRRLRAGGISGLYYAADRGTVSWTKMRDENLNAIVIDNRCEAWAVGPKGTVLREAIR